MDGETKKKTTFWLLPSTVQKVDNAMAADNCRSRSEFAEKAITFYLGYLDNRNAPEYMSEVLSTLITGILENNNNRLRTLIFKWAVELNMLCHMMAAHYRVDEIDRRALRAFAVDEVKRTKGKFGIDLALDIQRQLPEDDQWQD